jgi:alanine racemase
LNLETSLPPLPRDAYLSWLEIDLDAVRHNYRVLRTHVAAPTAVYAVIKADAYGHGAVSVARALLQEGATQFCVARVEEAAELRSAGITTPILVLAPPFQAQAAVAAKLDTSIVICDPTHAEAVAAAQQQSGHPIGVHIKTDVGMGRLGIPPAEVKSLLEFCDRLRVPVDGIMAHLPCADASSFASTATMIHHFRDLQSEILQSYPGRRLIFHVANSASTMRSADSWLDAVRCGISLYGQFPSVEMERQFDLRPAMTLKSRIGFIKDVPAGTPISYGHTYKTPAPARLATVPLGYADGWPRHASGKANFLVHGKPAPQVGRVCMDQVVLDITTIPEARLGDEVTAFGKLDDTILRAEDVAARFDSIGYELTTRIGKRLPRFYL